MRLSRSEESSKWPFSSLDVLESSCEPFCWGWVELFVRDRTFLVCFLAR
jgi:hypothetical protein